jgi:DNA-binding MarR family transcriptional regulator
MDALVETRERTIPFLMHQVVHFVESSVNERAKPYGLRIEGVRVLFRLVAQDNRSVNELSSLTGIEKSTLSRLLDRLEKRGLVKRGRDPEDGRSVIVSLTAKGRKLAQKHRPVYYRDYEGILLQGFDENEVARFRSDLVRMLENVQKLKNGREEWSDDV